MVKDWKTGMANQNNEITVYTYLYSLIIDFPYDPAILLLVYTQKMNIYVHTKICKWMFAQFCLKESKSWSNSNAHGLMNGYVKFVIFIQWNVI